MSTVAQNSARGALAALQQFVRKPHDRQSKSEDEPEEMCELCASPLAPQHHHLLELEKRSIICACDPCAILFCDGSSRQRYRRIPRDVRRLTDFALDDLEWDSLLIPIKLAFFVHSSSANKVVAQYPSPGGALESSLDLEYWDAIVDRNPVIKRFEPDVEALLVNRVSDLPQYYRAPIDVCYRLVGLIRMQWHGLSGGSEVWRQIDEFFRELSLRSGGRRA
ncbi:MAG: DUF5947 family protein [Candidatus Sulfotelmatobacter sp.]